MNKPLATVLIPVKNESAHLEELFRDLSRQTFAHGSTEVIFVDNASSDSSQEMIARFQASSDFSAVQLLENPESNFMLGLNRGAALARGDYILRWDAHGEYPPDYNDLCIARLKSGADVCGGNVDFCVSGPQPQNQLLLAAECSAFCGGNTRYRCESSEVHPARSVSHPSYRREILQRCGLWDKRMYRCEDNELHGRICRMGGEIVLDPAIHSVHYIRPDFRSMVLQNYGNGRGIATLLAYARDCVNFYHLVPLAFLCALVLGAVLCCFGVWLPLALLAGLYFACGFYFAAKAHVRGWLKLPAVFLCLHLAYGWGTLRGLVHCLLRPEKKPQADPMPSETEI